MIPILFNHDATVFTTHGIGDLYETIRCESVVNDDGEYELELDYPAGGKYISQLTINNIIVAKANDHGNYQAFRIYGIDKAINSLVTVHCQHLSYDLACVPVKPYESTTCTDAVSKLKPNAVGTLANPFTFYTNVTAVAQNIDGKFKMEEPKALRSALLDGEDSIKGTFGGDLVFDNYSVQLLAVGGADRGMLVEYGIDMMDMNQEENISEMITGVYPYWKGREENSTEDRIVYGDVQYATGTFSRQRIVPLDVAEYYPNNTSAPSVSEINQTARDWMTANEVGQPEINLKISYAEMGKDVRLHDAITVRFLKIGIDVKAKVISYKYDTLKERCVEIQVGNVKPSILFSLEDASRLKRGLIPPKRIQNNSITEEKLGTGSVGSGALQGGSVGTSKIAEAAVTTPKIGDWAITSDKLDNLCVTSAKIQNGAVGTLQLGENSVTHDKIGAGEVYTANLGNSSITSAKIQDAAVVTAKLGNYSVTFPKVANANIDQLKLNDFSVTSTKVADGDLAYNYATGQWEVRDPAIGTYALQNSAVVTAKIGDTQVAEIKLVKSAQNAIAAVWEIDRLVAGRIYSDGTVSCSSLILNGVQMRPRYITIGSSTFRVAAEVSD